MLFIMLRKAFFSAVHMGPNPGSPLNFPIQYSNCPSMHRGEIPFSNTRFLATLLGFFSCPTHSRSRGGLVEVSSHISPGTISSSNNHPYSKEQHPMISQIVQPRHYTSEAKENGPENRNRASDC